MKGSAYYNSVAQILADKKIRFTEHQLNNISKYLKRRYEELEQEKLKKETK